MAYCRLAKNNFKKLLTMVDTSYIIISVGWLVGRLKRKEMIHMSRRPKSKVINNPMYIVYHEVSLHDEIVLGVCDSIEKAKEIINNVIENKVLEDYAIFDFVELQSCRQTSSDNKDYVVIYKGDYEEIKCWFRIATVELNSLCYPKFKL